MSDYLTSLVSRSLAPAPGVRPRLPSIFEPPHLHPRLDAPSPFEEEAFSEPAPRLPLRQKSPPPQAPELPHRLAAEPEATSTPRQPAPKQVVPAGNETRAGESFTSVREAVPTKPPPSKTVVKPVALPINRSADPVPRREIVGLKSQEPNLEADKPASDHRLTEPNRQSANGRDSVASQQVRWQSGTPGKDMAAARSSRSGETPFPQNAAVAPPRKPDSPISPRLVSPRVRALPPTKEPAPTAPTIHITIGRVEVRAVPPPVREKARPKPQPGLSLEEYLRQRANGGRR